MTARREAGAIDPANILSRPTANDPSVHTSRPGIGDNAQDAVVSTALLQRACCSNCNEDRPCEDDRRKIAALRPGTVLALQRTIGNRNLGRILGAQSAAALRSRKTSPPIMQAMPWTLQRTPHSITGSNHPISPGRRAIQRTVDEMLVDCGEQRVGFRHDGQTTTYALDHCDVTEGSYLAQVRVAGNRVDFDLGETREGTHFDFRWAIRPGQANPSTFFAGQRTVRVVATSSAVGGVGAGSIRFNVTALTPEALRSLAGISPDALPEGRMIPLSSVGGVPADGGTPGSPSRPSILAPASAGASYFSPTPFTFLPRNSTGVLWTQGHTSIFSNPEAALFPTLRGYRGNLGYYLGELLPGVGRDFTIRLHEGVPGSFARDAIFPLMPGQQSYLYVARDADTAAAFATRLRNTEYGGQYTYSPPRSQPDPILGEVGPTEAQMYEILVRRGRAPLCTNNCITVPVPEIEGAIETRPTTPGGVDVISGQGPGGVDPHHAGRGRLMTEAMSTGPLPEGVQRLNIRVTPGGSTSMFLIRGGGTILLVYGLYHTEERVRASVGTGNLPTVVAEETGSWTGGILGSALGGAAGGAIFCAPTGPVDAVCVVGGFVGGLLFGVVGGALGSEVGHTAAEGRPPQGGILDTITAPAVERAGELHNYLEYNIRRLYGVPF